MQATWTVQLKTHPDFMRAFDEALAEDALATSYYEIIEAELWAVEGVFAAPPDMNTL